MERPGCSCWQGLLHRVPPAVLRGRRTTAGGDATLGYQGGGGLYLLIFWAKARRSAMAVAADVLFFFLRNSQAGGRAGCRKTPLPNHSLRPQGKQENGIVTVMAATERSRTHPVKNVRAHCALDGNTTFAMSALCFPRPSLFSFPLMDIFKSQNVFSAFPSLFSVKCDRFHRKARLPISNNVFFFYPF